MAANGSVNLEAIQPSYFETFGVAVDGRPFDRRDREDAPAVAIVSVDVASRLWPGQDPIGKRLKMGDLDSKDTWRTVVGVASRTRYRDLHADHTLRSRHATHRHRTIAGRAIDRTAVTGCRGRSERRAGKRSCRSRTTGCAFW